LLNDVENHEDLGSFITQRKRSGVNLIRRGIYAIMPPDVETESIG
jgi:hypothetical protein